MAGSSIATQGNSVSSASAQPPSLDELKANLRLLFSAFKTTDSESSEQIAATYLLVLKQYSAQAIHSGIMKLIDGRVPEHDATWLPSCAIVARAVRAEDEQIKVRLELKWRHRVRGWRDAGLWDEAWGPKPGETGCECPGFLLADDYRLRDSVQLLEKLA